VSAERTSTAVLATVENRRPGTRPVLLLVESKRARFSEHVKKRTDLDTILLRLGSESDRLGANAPRGTDADEKPTFALDEHADLGSEIERFHAWTSAIGQVPTYFCNPNEAVQATAQRFARAAGLPALSEEQVAQVHEKPAMKAMYAELGIPHATFRYVSQPQEIAAFGREYGWPLILKPIDSDTCIGTYKLTGPEDPDIAQVADKKYTWIVEEYIEGTEYQLCALVANGVVLDAFVSLNPAPIIDYLEGAMNANITLAPSEVEPIDGRVLAQQLTDAVGYEDGYLHGEFFMRGGSEFIMGELAARLSGCEVPLNHGLAYGFDILDAISDLYVGQARPPVYSLDRSVGDLLLPTAPGTVIAISDPESLLALPGVISCSLSAKVGDTLNPPRASSASSGFVQVEGTNSAEVSERMQAVLDHFVLEVSAQEPTSL
jgi:biotin carboxylase